MPMTMPSASQYWGRNQRAARDEAPRVVRGPRTEGCRRELFEKVDLPALRPLPPYRYEYTEIRKARVNIDYHVEYKKKLYCIFWLNSIRIGVRINQNTQTRFIGTPHSNYDIKNLPYPSPQVMAQKRKEVAETA